MIARLRIRTRTTGPMFDGRAIAAVHDFADDLEEDGAEMALRSIQRTYATNFQAPTGYYESNVHTSRAADGWEVTDGGLSGPVYGPWLEGVGSRNNTTRFKGYHAFRKAAQMLERRIEERGRALLFRNHIRRMN